ncbi:hypothetical protein J6590_060035 [Homalodisca vitripennis]|nr:hypothetical protein J6590_060035 [Homalodisca vitripennis]
MQYKTGVSTLPHIKINQDGALLNGYIEELCVRYRGAVVLDFNQISESAFTQHGMYLKQSSKHLLAELLNGRLRRMSGCNLRTSSRNPTTNAEPPSTQPQESPNCSTADCLGTVSRCSSPLPYDSFVGTVKSGSAMNSPTRVNLDSSTAIGNVIKNVSSAISDHFAQETVITHSKPNFETPSVKIKRDVKPANVNLYYKYLMKE